MATVLEATEIDARPISAHIEGPFPLPLPLTLESRLARLVKAARRGDRQAWDTLIRLYQRSVLEVIRRRVKTEADAEEICQEVFLQAIRKLSQLKEPEAIGGWLRRIAERLSLNFLTRSRSSKNFDDRTWEDHNDGRNEPFKEVSRREAQDAVWQGLNQLGAMDREALFAFYIEGKSLSQMSEEFAVPLGTVKRRLHVARKRLAKHLAPLNEG